MVFTAGYASCDKKNGELLINGKPESLLNGAQIMGMRPPLEPMAKHNRCAPLWSR